MKLLPPKGYETTRPITDRAKESLFSVLYKYDVIEDGVVADLFCGTGSMGLECLSRGARWATFVDRDRKVAAILNQNIERADFLAESKTILANIFKVGAPVPSGCEGQDKYTLVFVDPPYKLAYDTDENSQLGKLLLLINEQIADDAVIVVRTSKRAALLDRYGDLVVVDRREWGSMAVTLLQLAGEDSQGSGVVDDETQIDKDVESPEQ